MQLIYGNDGINYRVFAKSVHIPLRAENLLKSSYMHYHFVNKSQFYASIKNEPEALSYVTSNLENSFEKEHLVIVKCGRMSKFFTPSFFSHVYIKDIDEDYYKKQFFEIFNYKFIDDIEIDQYNNENIDEFKMITRLPEKYDYLEKDQLIAIIANFFYYENINRKVKILVDKNGNNYNQRSREILISIYTHLPYLFRKRYGFLSYANENQNISARISFLLFNKEELSDIDDTYIDLNNIDLQSLQQQVGKEIYEYATYLAELTKTEAEQYFNQLVKKKIIRLMDFVFIYNKEKRWLKADIEELLPEWIEYINKINFRRDKNENILLNIIRKRIDSEKYNAYIFKILSDNSFLNLSNVCKRSLQIIDVIDGLTLDIEKFNLWYEEDFNKRYQLLLNNIDLKFEEENILSSKIELYSNEISIITNSNLRITQLDNWKDEKIAQYKKNILKYQEKLKKYVDNEKKNVLKEMIALENMDIKLVYSKLESFTKKIKYKENHLILKNNSKNLFFKIVDRYICSNLSLNKCQELLNYLAEIEKKLDINIESERNKLSEHIKDQKYKIENKILLITKREDIIKLIEEIHKIKELPFQKNITVSFNNIVKKELSLDEANDFVTFMFVFSSNKKNYNQNIYDIIFDNNIFTFLIDNRFFLIEHFIDLVSHVQNLFHVKAIFNYFNDINNSDFLISDHTLNKGLQILKENPNKDFYKKANDTLNQLVKHEKKLSRIFLKNK